MKTSHLHYVVADILAQADPQQFTAGIEVESSDRTDENGDIIVTIGDATAITLLHTDPATGRARRFRIEITPDPL